MAEMSSPPEASFRNLTAYHGPFLEGCHVDFRKGALLCLLAYRVLNEQTIKLLMVGSQENFYRDLKRTGH